ncbi:MAG: L-threonylcarbamoyladenylate synthase RimN [Rhodobacteraceae bacterium HLUCCA12]|nr:MAG: L-threonylcarbamoyladenylate synthase RimN [Rhodobacteraceae bacterium HLUCCA12]
MTRTLVLSATHAGLSQAADLLRQGALVAMPTETVYGLAGDARSDMAVARIFAAKNRPRFNPLIVHLASLGQVRAIAHLTPLAERLARAFWPGPLTLVLPLAAGAGLSPLVTAGLDTVAIRLPAHPVARALLTRFGGPVAAPSANPSGRISPVTVAHVLAGLDGRIDAIVDGGDCPVGLESTILDATGTVPRLLREGGLPREAIEAVTGESLVTDPAPADRIAAPGQLPSHYAPRGAVRLEVRKPDPDEIWIGFGAACPGTNNLTLSETADLTEAAARLFHLLHRADALAGDGGRIAVAPIPDIGLGRAINDRLRRAAAPR